MTYPPDLVDPKDLYKNVSESIFQTDVIKIARDLGYEVYHHTTAGTRCRKCGEYSNRGRIVTSKGFPDLVLIRPDRLIYAELKSRTGKQAPEQKHWQALLEANGAEYHLWKPENLDELIEELA